MSKRKPNWTDREKVALLEEYEKRKVILKAKFSSSITYGGKNVYPHKVIKACIIYVLKN
jgi:hypothetical protein